ncbi:N-acetylglucosamine kinase [Amycolatopsis antarctica]|uniref:N-acetylglucosamine kinase n=1 Tax=Amycolatopsis antarctica TaxID=1854586 RepID=A0A263D0I1_9PSEU|nr:N-acetylglucosamine kinase [Amycolatopsis antarctica]
MHQEPGRGYVLGVDAGGTSSRALLTAADGTVLGTGRSGGANPNSHPPAEAAAHIVEALAAALDAHNPGRVRACVVGLAGASKLTDPAVAELFGKAWAGLGLGCEVRVVSDAEAAFASATSAADGTVLVAGTGSIAGRIRQRRRIATAGGYGWLLGDEGSGFWIGREAVRSALATLTADREEPGPLARAVLTEALGAHEAHGTGLRTAHRLITTVNGQPPVRLARFAPLVSALADTDEAAGTIVGEAAAHLVRIALASRDAGERTPVVLVGSVLGEGSPVGARVREQLAGVDVLASSDGVAGANWLAAVEAFGEQAPRPLSG